MCLVSKCPWLWEEGYSSRFVICFLSKIVLLCFSPNKVALAPPRSHSPAQVRPQEKSTPKKNVKHLRSSSQLQLEGEALEVWDFNAFYGLKSATKKTPNGVPQRGAFFGASLFFCWLTVSHPVMQRQGKTTATAGELRPKGVILGWKIVQKKAGLGMSQNCKRNTSIRFLSLQINKFNHFSSGGGDGWAGGMPKFSSPTLGQTVYHFEYRSHVGRAPGPFRNRNRFSFYGENLRDVPKVAI